MSHGCKKCLARLLLLCLTSIPESLMSVWCLLVDFVHRWVRLGEGGTFKKIFLYIFMPSQPVRWGWEGDGGGGGGGGGVIHSFP